MMIYFIICKIYHVRIRWGVILWYDVIVHKENTSGSPFNWSVIGNHTGSDVRIVIMVTPDDVHSITLWGKQTQKNTLKTYFDLNR